MLPNLNKQGIKEFVVETNQMGRLLARLPEHYWNQSNKNFSLKQLRSWIISQ